MNAIDEIRKQLADRENEPVDEERARRIGELLARGALNRARASHQLDDNEKGGES